jgi:DNA-binding NarL/FixJ family response regulator
VGEAKDGREALEMVDELRPDVVVMDISMPHLNGLDATRQIKRFHPEVQVLFLTMHESADYVRQLVKAGAIGCIVKRSAARELIQGVQAAARGESFFSPVVAGELLDDYRCYLEQCDVQDGDELTDREREVVQLIAEGRTNQEIAGELFITVRTVQTHRMHLMHKLDMHDRTDLVKYAVRTGMIAVE